MNDITNNEITNTQPSSSQSIPSSSQQKKTEELAKVEREREHHRAKFNEWLNNDYKRELLELNQKRKARKGIIQETNGHSTCKIIDQEKADKIILYLKNIINSESPIYDSNFQSWVKNSNFNIQNIAGAEVLYKRQKEKKQKENNNNRTRSELNAKENIPVAIKENFFDLIYSLHAIQKGHHGVLKTADAVNDRYCCIPRAVVNSFIRLCGICNLNKQQQSQNRIHPISSFNFLERFQLDLVDMRHNPSKFDVNQYIDKTNRKKNNNNSNTNEHSYYWIAHVEDHFTKLHILWPQETKTMEETAAGFERYVLAYFGLPSILHTDNGQEFVNKCMRHLLINWDGNCKHKRGKPRRPNVQGLVEQANGTMEKMIGAMQAQFKIDTWHTLLPKIQYNLNTQKCSCMFIFIFFYLINTFLFIN
jgi:hypothetical protein